MYPLTVYFDSASPVCNAESAALRSRDRHARLRFVDIAAPDFEAPQDTDVDALDAALHVRLADGRLLRGVEAVRAAYGAAGLGALMAPTTWPVLRPLAERTYRGFARHRHALPAPLERLLVTLLGHLGGREGHAPARGA